MADGLRGMYDAVADLREKWRTGRWWLCVPVDQSGLDSLRDVFRRHYDGDRDSYVLGELRLKLRGERHFVQLVLFRRDKVRAEELLEELGFGGEPRAEEVLAESRMLLVGSGHTEPGRHLGRLVGFLMGVEIERVDCVSEDGWEL